MRENSLKGPRPLSQKPKQKVKVSLSGLSQLVEVVDVFGGVSGFWRAMWDEVGLSVRTFRKEDGHLYGKNENMFLHFAEYSLREIKDIAEYCSEKLFGRIRYSH